MNGPKEVQGVSTRYVSKASLAVKAQRGGVSVPGSGECQDRSL